MRFTVGVLLALLLAAPAQAQDVDHFLKRVDRLLARGPFALFSRDFYRRSEERRVGKECRL